MSGFEHMGDKMVTPGEVELMVHDANKQLHKALAVLKRRRGKRGMTFEGAMSVSDMLHTWGRIFHDRARDWEDLAPPNATS